MQSLRRVYAPRRSMKQRDINSESRAVFRKQFYKTEMCRFYRLGCARGDRCCFAHGEEDLQTAPDLTKTSLCQAWVERRCPLTSEECQFAHGWSDLHVTQDFQEYGARQQRQRGGQARSAGEGDVVDNVNHSPSGATRGTDQSAAETAAASPAGAVAVPAVEPQPSAEGAPAAGPAVPATVVLQLWGLPTQGPLVPVQLVPVGVAQPVPAQQFPDGRAMEMLLRQAMPNHYED